MTTNLDWAAMLAGNKTPDKAPDNTCSHSESGYRLHEVVTETTSQTRDSIEKPKACNHVTTVTTDFQDDGGSGPSACVELPGGGGRSPHAPETKAACLRPVIDYGLTDRGGIGGRMVGEPGDVLADLVRDLRARYGDRLDWVTLRERFEERAAIVEFDGRLTREQAEAAAAKEVREAMGRP